MPPLYGISSQQTRRVLTPALRVAKRKFRTTGGETPPLQILAFVRRGCPKAPFREGGGAVRRQGESAQLRNSFLFWIPPAKLWVRQPDEFPYFAKRPLPRVLPHPLTQEPPPGGSLEYDRWSPAVPAKSNPVGGIPYAPALTKTNHHRGVGFPSRCAEFLPYIPAAHFRACPV